MHPVRTATSSQVLAEEMTEATASGTPCGHGCGWHSAGRAREGGESFALVCSRSEPHGALMTDTHAGWDENGAVTTFTCTCEPAP